MTYTPIDDTGMSPEERVAVITHLVQLARVGDAYLTHYLGAHTMTVAEIQGELWRIRVARDQRAGEIVTRRTRR